MLKTSVSVGSEGGSGSQRREMRVESLDAIARKWKGEGRCEIKGERKKRKDGLRK
jgi:hypothetical protein